MIAIGISKAQKLETQHHHDAMVKMQSSDKAKEWFRRKPYEIRSGAGGQSNYERERAKEKILVEVSRACACNKKN